MNHPQWIRIAGNATRIREGDRFAWRCFIGREHPEVPLCDVVLQGSVSATNYKVGVAPERDHLGLVAWFDVYGVARVEDHVLTVDLHSPPV